MTDEKIKAFALLHMDIEIDRRGREEYSCDDHGLIAFARRLLADHAEREAALRAAIHTCLWAMRQPLDGWKGDCERKAMDKANAALAQAKDAEARR